MSGSPLRTPVDLERALGGVEGWLNRGEAWALYRAVLDVDPAREVLAVDVGSYLGRSAIALGLAMRDRGGGRVVTVDPQSPQRHERLVGNIEARGLADVVEALPIGSGRAAEQARDGSVDVLFVDGDHSFEGVTRDMVVWRPKLADGAFVGFNDPFWAGVNRFLREYVFALSSPFRDPQIVDNTLFVTYRPTAPLTRVELELFPRLRRFLARGRIRHVLDRPPEKRSLVPQRYRSLGARLDRRLFPRVVVAANRAAERAAARRERQAEERMRRASR